MHTYESVGVKTVDLTTDYSQIVQVGTMCSALHT